MCVCVCVCVYTHTQLKHFAVYLQVTQYCKSTIVFFLTTVLVVLTTNKQLFNQLYSWLTTISHKGTAFMRSFVSFSQNLSS